jgi:uncharacterized caspase-like protein
MDMKNILTTALAALALLAIAAAPSAYAAAAEKRMALVIGNGAYQTSALATPANDAGLIAQTLQAAGFDVVGARDLDEDSLRHAFRDFVDNVSKAGPDAVVAVYFAGYGLQLAGENYLVPIDADIARDADVPVRALRLSDYTRALAALHLKATFVVLDAARASPFSTAGQPLAGGLALVDPEPGMLIAFNAAPGTVAPEGQDGYGAYAKSLAEMIRAGGLAPADVFDRVRLRVNEVTQGAQVPWDASKVQSQFVFFERGPDAPPPPAQTASIRTRPLRDLGAQDAYLAALSRDTLDAYEDFLSAYPRDAMAMRVRALVAARREAITWRRTYQVDSPDAYWSYLQRYPRGSHAADARRRLAQVAAALEPPPRFAMIDYDVPPPPPEETVYYERPVLAFDDPIFAFAPPPPPPAYFLEPPPPEFVVLEPPPPPFGAYILPMPVFVPVPVYVSAPAYVVPPPNPIIFNNIHNRVMVNTATNVVTITNRSGQVVSPPNSAAAAGRGAGPAMLAPALPPSVAPKAALASQSPQPPAAKPASQGAIKVPPGQSTSPATGTPATGNRPTSTAPTATLSPPTGNKPLPIPPANFLAPSNGKKPASTAPTATLAPPTGNKPLPTPSAAAISAPENGKKPASTAPTTATLSLPPAGSKPAPTPSAAAISAPENGKKPASTAPTTATLAPPPASIKPAPTPAPVVHPPTPPVVHPPAPPIAHLTPPSAPVVHQPPPPAPVVRQAPPPPPVVHQAPPPPPPPPAGRQVQAPPPPRPPAPPPAAAAKPKCPVVNGKEVCSR